MKIKTHELHKKAYAQTWQYDDSVLKLYSVRLKIKYLPGGGVFSVYERVEAYTCEDAALIAKEQRENDPCHRTGKDEIIEAEPIQLKKL